MNTIYEIDYEIESIYDLDGDFPLECAAVLFELLNIKTNFIIKNRSAVRKEKDKIISKYINNNQNIFYELEKYPKVNFSLWIKEDNLTNNDIIDILKLQVTDLSFIVPNNLFDWNRFLTNWKKDVDYLVSSDEATFACNIIDMDRTINMIFNTSVYSMETINKILVEWENAMMSMAQSSKVKRTEYIMKEKRKKKPLIQLIYK